MNKSDELKLKTFILLLILLGIITIMAIDPAKSIWMPKCPIWLTTGLYCPGCGSQRAAHALLTGHLAEAFRFNFYLVFAWPYLAALVIERMFLTGNTQLRWRKFLEHKYTICFYLATYFIWFVVRNLLKI